MRLDQDTFYNLTVLLLHQHDEHTISIANDFIKAYREDKNTLLDQDKEIIDFYIHILKEILDNGLVIKSGDTDLDKEKNNDTLILLSKYTTSPVALKYPSILKSLTDMVNNRLSEKAISNVRRDVTNNLLYKRSIDNVKKIYGYLGSFDSLIDSQSRNEQIELFKSSVSDLNETVASTHLNVLADLKGTESISANDPEDVRRAVTENIEMNDARVFQTGIQGLNKTLSPFDGFTCGSQTVYCALSNNYKSAGLLNTARWAVDYGELHKHYKDPMILFISLENIASYNFMKLFTMFYYNEYQDDPDIINRIKRLKVNDIMKFTSDYLKKRKVHLRIERYRPAEFSHITYEALIKKYTDQGYTVCNSILDYLSLMGAGPFGNMPKNQLIQAQFNYVCNFNKDMKITFHTGHQLNKKAREIASTKTDPILAFDDTCIADSFDVMREIDLLYFYHIERMLDGKTFITFRKYKDRYNEQTPENLKYCAYQLYPVIGIKDDINGKFEGYRSLAKLRAELAATVDTDSSFLF
jgi:hypothetical protein